MARVAHPNVVVVYDIGLFEGRIFVSMELVEGCDLWRWLRESPRSWQNVLPILIEAGEGLCAAHAAGLVHRDFKPSNVLVGVDGRVRLCDFGFARLGEAARAGSGANRGSRGGNLSAGEIAERLLDFADGGLHPTGTPLYTSPEQYLGDPVTEAADQFSFCVVSYESIYGMRPFSGTTVPELRAGLAGGQLRARPPDPSVPEWLHRVLLTGLQLQPERRHASMTALLSALRNGRESVRVSKATPVEG
jgi:serine/threonine protein kinase